MNSSRVRDSAASVALWLRQTTCCSLLAAGTCAMRSRANGGRAQSRSSRSSPGRSWLAMHTEASSEKPPCPQASMSRGSSGSSSPRWANRRSARRRAGQGLSICCGVIPTRPSAVVPLSLPMAEPAHPRQRHDGRRPMDCNERTRRKRTASTPPSSPRQPGSSSPRCPQTSARGERFEETTPQIPQGRRLNCHSDSSV